MRLRAIIVGAAVCLGLVAVLLSGAAAGPLAQSTSEDDILEAFETEAYAVSQVRLQGVELLLTYQQSAIQDQTSLPYVYLDMMMMAAELAPTAEKISLEVIYLGDPFFRMTATASELHALREAEITVPEFYRTVRFDERRSLAVILEQRFLSRMLIYDGYTLEAEKLYIPVKAANLAPAEMVTMAIDLASAAAGSGAGIELITVGFFDPLGRETRMQLEASQALAYQNDEQSLLEVVAGVTLVEAASARQQSPLLGRFLGVMELALAAMAAAFYGISAVRLRRWSIALKAGFLVVLPAFVAGIVMLILSL